LITGGTGGVGFEAAKALRREGATLILGSRDPERFAKTAAELGNDGIHPFIADITDSAEVDRQLTLMRLGGLDPTDVIHSAAGGMEPLLRDVARLTAGLRKLHGSELDRAHAAARAEVAPLVANTRELAMAVNCVYPSRLLDALAPKLPAGGTVTFYSSLWASLHPDTPQVPVFYEAVAEGKQALERWLERRANAWAALGITTTVISAQPILNTRMGYLLDRFCGDILSPDDRERWRSSCVSCSDLVDATLELLRRASPQGVGKLVRLFIPGPGDVTDRIAANDPRMPPIAWARNAPIWG
jgi:NAD(P)-dependent dehydrogenase (short-subunit alcohol dehydrogenase family)